MPLYDDTGNAVALTDGNGAVIEAYSRWDTEDDKFRHWVQPPTGPEVVEDIPFEKLIELGSAPR